jgi:hypothetical protein
MRTRVKPAPKDNPQNAGVQAYSLKLAYITAVANTELAIETRDEALATDANALNTYNIAMAGNDQNAIAAAWTAYVNAQAALQAAEEALASARTAEAAAQQASAAAQQAVPSPDSQ